MVYEVISNTLQKVLGIDDGDIRPGAMIKKDLQLDSTESVAIALELKKNFGVDYKFPAEDVSLEHICAQVNALLN